MDCLVRVGKKIDSRYVIRDRAGPLQDAGIFVLVGSRSGISQRFCSRHSMHRLAAEDIQGSYDFGHLRSTVQENWQRPRGHTEIPESRDAGLIVA